MAKAKEELEVKVKVKERTASLEKALENLSRSEERFRTFQETTEDGFAILGVERDQSGEVKDFICQYANPGAAWIMRSSPEKCIGKRLTEIFSDAKDEKAGGQFYVWKKVVDSGRQDLLEFSYHLHGKMHWFTSRAVKLGDGVAVYIIDFTEKKRLEQSLKNYAKRITQVQEEERKRIAYELHDDTAQYLSILKLQIGALASSEEIQSLKLKERL